MVKEGCGTGWSGRGWRAAGVVLALLLILPGGAAVGQSAAGPYLPLDSWEHDVVERLRARGLLPGLSAITRPYRAGEVRRALASVDRSRLSPLERKWMERLDSALAVPDPGAGLRWRLGIAPEVQAGTSISRERFFPWGKGGRWLALEAEGVLAADALVLHVVPRFDRRPAEDDRYGGNKIWWGTRGTYREKTAYVLAAGEYASFFAGRIARNWGPDAGQSLVLGKLSYPYDHVAWGLALGPVRVTQLLGELDEIGGFKRHLIANRLEAELGGRLSLAVTRSYVRATEKAFELGALTRFRGDSANTYTAVDVLWRAGERTEFFLQALEDRPRRDSASSGAIEVGIRDAGRWNPVDLELTYTLVGSRTYRPYNRPQDSYLFWYTGLGLDRSDFERWTLRATVHPHADARLVLLAEHLRQGAGDPRLRREFAPGSDWLASAAQVTWRFGVDVLVRAGPLGEIRANWGRLNRDLRVVDETVRDGWANEWWISYRRYFGTRGRMQGAAVSQAGQ